MATNLPKLTAQHMKILEALESGPAYPNRGACYPAGMNGHRMGFLKEHGLVEVTGERGGWRLTAAGRSLLVA